MRDILSRIFRSLNSGLLYSNTWLWEKFLKVNLVVSRKFYKKWMRQKRAEEHITLTDIDGNLIMKVDVSKAIGAAFYWMGLHELNEWRFLQRFLKPDMVFLDIGANQGEFTLFSAKRLVNGKVFAFEPVDYFYEMLMENIRVNRFSNIKAFHFGLSDENKNLPIYMGQTGAGENEGLATIFQSDMRGRFIQNVEVRILDEIIPSLNLVRIDFIKIDVEGAEISVLLGAKNTLEHFRPHVMVEMSKDTFATAGYTQEDVVRFFTDRNYTLHVIGRQGNLETARQVPSFCNVVFVPN